jgi:Ca2+:H+ antiporter
MRSQLRGSDDNEDSKPWHRKDRAWMRLRVNFLRLTRKTLVSNYANFMLVFVPIGVVIGVIESNPAAVFIASFLAIVPLAALLSFATERLSVMLGQVVGGVTNAIFGNAVELIVSTLNAVECK